MDEKPGESEPTRFAWIRDGLLVAGTLSDWAKMWEGDYYAGDNGLTATLITWDGDENTTPQFHKVDVKQAGVDEDETVKYVFTVPGLHDQVVKLIDGLA